jgi:hypothetical protein
MGTVGRPMNPVSVMAPATGKTAVEPVPYITGVDQFKVLADLPLL